MKMKLGNIDTEKFNYTSFFIENKFKIYTSWSFIYCQHDDLALNDFLSLKDAFGGVYGIQAMSWHLIEKLIK